MRFLLRLLLLFALGSYLFAGIHSLGEPADSDDRLGRR